MSVFFFHTTQHVRNILCRVFDFGTLTFYVAFCVLRWRVRTARVLEMCGNGAKTLARILARRHFDILCRRVGVACGATFYVGALASALAWRGACGAFVRVWRVCGVCGAPARASTHNDFKLGLSVVRCLRVKSHQYIQTSPKCAFPRV